MADLETVDTERLNELERDQRLLRHLQAAGVDDWEGYDLAVEEFNEEEAER